MSDTPDILKIIASETARLTPDDRAAIARAAEELEMSNKQAYLANVALVECRQQIIALNDRIIQLTAELQRNRQSVQAEKAQPWSMGSGWLEVRPNNA